MFDLYYQSISRITGHAWKDGFYPESPEDIVELGVPCNVRELSREEADEMLADSNTSDDIKHCGRLLIAHYGEDAEYLYFSYSY